MENLQPGKRWVGAPPQLHWLKLAIFNPNILISMWLANDRGTPKNVGKRHGFDVGSEGSNNWTSFSSKYTSTIMKPPWKIRKNTHQQKLEMISHTSLSWPRYQRFFSLRQYDNFREVLRIDVTTTFPFDECWGTDGANGCWEDLEVGAGTIGRRFGGDESFVFFV